MTNDTTSDRWTPIRTTGRLSAHLRARLTVLLVVVVAELIGTITFPLGPDRIMLLPLLYTVVLGLTLNYSVLGSAIEPLRPVVDEDVSRTAPPLLVVALMPLDVEYETLVAPSFYDFVAAGPAFTLQGFGNLGTIFVTLLLALPLGLEHESIGTAVSIIREPTPGVTTGKYGIESPEGRGVFGTYMTGTALGAVFFGLPDDFAPATGLYPLALSIACGMGSTSVVTACSTPLATAVGGAGVAEDQILSFVATSNLLTGIIGLYMVILAGPPVITRPYAVLAPVFGRGTATADGGK